MAAFAQGPAVPWGGAQIDQAGGYDQGVHWANMHYRACRSCRHSVSLTIIAPSLTWQGTTGVMPLMIGRSWRGVRIRCQKEWTRMRLSNTSLNIAAPSGGPAVRAMFEDILETRTRVPTQHRRQHGTQRRTAAATTTAATAVTTTTTTTTVPTSIATINHHRWFPGDGMDAKTIDNANFIKMIKKAPGFLTKRVTTQHVDVVFTKCKPRGGRRLNYSRFLDALFQLGMVRYPDEDPVNAFTYMLTGHIFGLLASGDDGDRAGATVMKVHPYHTAHVQHAAKAVLLLDRRGHVIVGPSSHTHHHHTHTHFGLGEGGAPLSAAVGAGGVRRCIPPRRRGVGYGSQG